jgi:hypothetical protein
MQDNEALASVTPKRGAWNKGNLIGAEPPLRTKHVGSIRNYTVGLIGFGSNMSHNILFATHFPKKSSGPTFV